MAHFDFALRPGRALRGGRALRRGLALGHVSGLVFVLLSCTTKKPAPETPGAPDAGASAPAPAFSAEMQSMAASVRALVPFLYDRAAFALPEHRARVETALDRLARASHQVEAKAGERILGDALLVDLTLAHLRDDLERARSSYHQGQYEFARGVAKQSLNNCFQCHSVTRPGGSAAWEIEDLGTLRLAPLEKFDLLVATRKFDRAVVLAETLLADPQFTRDHAFEFESLIRRYLALVIRVEVAPERARAALDRVLEKVELPRYVAEQLEAWRGSLKVWAKEPVRKVKSPTDLFRQVTATFTRAARLQRYEKDHAGDVEYLRATAILHNNLNALDRPNDRARGLYLLGRAYEVMDDLGQWSLHENYYEACLLKDPKGPLARTCFTRLQASLYMGFSGSAGTQLPAEERERLRRLEQML